MREYKPELHPEFSNRWRATADLPRAREADYQDALNIFRTDIAKTFGEVDTNEPIHWLMFTFGKEGIHPESGGGIADLLILQTLQEVQSPSGVKLVKSSVRMVYSELYKIGEEKNFFTIDVTIDHEDDSQYLAGIYPITSSDDNEEPFIPIAVVTDEHGLVMSPNFTPFTRIYDLFEEYEGEVYMPFGHYLHPQDRHQALEKAIFLLGLTFGREADAQGNTFIYSVGME